MAVESGAFSIRLIFFEIKGPWNEALVEVTGMSFCQETWIPRFSFFLLFLLPWRHQGSEWFASKKTSLLTANLVQLQHLTKTRTKASWNRRPCSKTESGISPTWHMDGPTRTSDNCNITKMTTRGILGSIQCNIIILITYLLVGMYTFLGMSRQDSN